MPANTSRNVNKINSPIVKVALCSLFSAVLHFVLIAVFAVLALKYGMSASSYMPAGFAFGAVTGFINGFVIARLVREKGALYGLISGFIQSLLCVVALFLINGGTAGMGLLIVSALIIVFSIVGGVAGVNLKIKKKY